MLANSEYRRAMLPVHLNAWPRRPARENNCNNFASTNPKLSRVGGFALANIADDPAKPVERLMEEWNEGAQERGPRNLAANQNMAIAER